MILLTQDLIIKSLHSPKSTLEIIFALCTNKNFTISLPDFVIALENLSCDGVIEYDKVTRTWNKIDE